MKVDAIQKFYQAIYLSLKDVYKKEIEALLSRDKFQDAITLAQKDNIPNVP
jgi:hypothetical protein